MDPWTSTHCKLQVIFYFWKHYSSSLLVLMSIEKCFAVYFPLKSKTICTVRTAKWATGIVGAILVVYNIVRCFALEPRFIESSGDHICVALFLSWATLKAVDSALYSFGPFIIMFLTNFAIVFKFMRAKCQSNSTESTNQALAKVATRGTTMVVTVSVMFLILTAPTALNQALWHVTKLSSNPIYRLSMNLTQYLNHSINGVLYCIVGSRFRKEFLKIFCRKKRTNDTFISHSSSTSVVTIRGKSAWITLCTCVIVMPRLCIPILYTPLTCASLLTRLSFQFFTHPGRVHHYWQGYPSNALHTLYVCIITDKVVHSNSLHTLDVCIITDKVILPMLYTPWTCASLLTRLSFHCFTHPLHVHQYYKSLSFPTLYTPWTSPSLPSRFKYPCT